MKQISANLLITLSAYAFASLVAVLHSWTAQNTSRPLMTGWIQQPPGHCHSRTVDCTTVNTGFICMSNDPVPQQVFGKDEFNMCNLELYRSND